MTTNRTFHSPGALLIVFALFFTAFSWAQTMPPSVHLTFDGDDPIENHGTLEIVFPDPGASYATLTRPGGLTSKAIITPATATLPYQFQLPPGIGSQSFTLSVFSTITSRGTDGNWKDLFALAIDGDRDGAYNSSDNGANPDRYLALEGKNPATGFSVYSEGSNGVDCGSVASNTGTLHHFVFVCNNGVISVFVNGKKETGTTTVVDGDIFGFALGGRYARSDRAAGNRIDDIRLYEYAMEDTQVQQIYQAFRLSKTEADILAVATEATVTLASLAWFDAAGSSVYPEPGDRLSLILPESFTATLSLAGEAALLNPLQVFLGNASNLAIQNLSGSGSCDLTLNGTTADNSAVLESIGDYSGTLTISGSTVFSLGSGLSTLPMFSLQSGTFAVTDAVTLTQPATFAGGTVDLSNAEVSETDAAFILTDSANVVFQDGTKTRFSFDIATIPSTFRLFDLSPGAVLAGWDISHVMFSRADAYPSFNADGSVTFTQNAPVAFETLPDWSGKTFPEEARPITLTATVSFDGKTEYNQELDSKTATVARILETSGTVSVYGLHSERSSGGKYVRERDIWLNLTDGSYDYVVGGADNHWQNNNYTVLTGDILLQLEGNVRVNHVVGGNAKEGTNADLTRLTGNTGVILKGNARVKGNIIGAFISNHNQTPIQNGNASVLIQNIQSETDSNAALSNQSAMRGTIVGGPCWAANTASGGRLTGSSSVTVDIESGTGDFVKTIVGGGYASKSSGADTASCNVAGSSSVTITAPETVKFDLPVYGGGYSASSGNAASIGGNATLTLNGGTYTSTLVAGGFGASATVTGNAILTLNGGVFQNAVLKATDNGSTVQGETTLVIANDVTFSNATVSEFDQVAVTADGNLKGSGTIASAVVFAEGSRLEAIPSETAEGLMTFDGAVTGQAILAVAPGFVSSPSTKYYVAKGDGITVESLAALGGIVLEKDEAGIYFVSRFGTRIILY